ncbi:KPN_02809 family neutral zinc metallopeptidase [Notoacmeibacter ruber]|uniref:Flagellar biosynthesis protein FlgM n=1 Tax=Notoacmeibacter ruber TaxID=2670375 RepID=A0A3L7JCB4_9HYPH|nr:neutral zinc metallopeptidase [Notoacmeibacter ruber]RLQ88296.1 flagellar biosynthesis protein FlgM [Notoacmeibacter ruber]
MRWRGRRGSSNIEDRRGEGGFGGGIGRGGRMRIPGGIPIGGRGGLSIGTIVLLIVVFFVLQMCGVPIGDILSGGGGSVGTPQTQSERTTNADGASDEMRQFVSVVLAETEEVWNGIFEQQGDNYREPTLVLFSGSTQAGCGFASAASGPFYCPVDQKVYLDTSFFQTLAERFNASGDFAAAYVIAHEVGHHVQNLIGVLPKFNEARQRMSETEANAMSVRVELMADCFAGVWAYYTDQKGLLEEGDIQEALNAAEQIGDDTLQRRTQGYVVPESFNHGTSEQRQTWFAKGFESGRMNACDTMNNPV